MVKGVYKRIARRGARLRGASAAMRAAAVSEINAENEAFINSPAYVNYMLGQMPRDIQVSVMARVALALARRRAAERAAREAAAARVAAAAENARRIQQNARRRNYGR